MSLLQFVGYLTVQLIATGAITLLVLLGVLHALDWWMDRR